MRRRPSRRYRLLLAWALNAGALALAHALFGHVHIHGAWAYIIGSAVLGVANTVLKPLLTILTLPLVLLSFGLFYFVINIAMVALAASITPNLSIHGFWTYAGTVVIVWLVNWVGGRAFDRLPATLGG